MSRIQQVCLATISGMTVSQFSELLKTVTSQDLNQPCTFRRNGVDVTYTALYSACREGNVELVECLLSVPGIEVNGLQYPKFNETPLLAAQTGGWVSIVTLLLISGAEASIEKRLNLDSGTQKQLNNIWNIYGKLGPLGLIVDFPNKGKFLARSKIYPQVEHFFTKIDEFIIQNSSLPNLMWTKRVPSTGNPANSLVTALETLLISLKYAVGNQPNFLETAFQEHFRDNTSQPKPSLLSAFPQMFNINVVVILYNPVNATVVRKKYYVNPYKRKDYPFVYIAFNGIRYDALLPNNPYDTGTNTEGPLVTIQQLFEAIDNLNLHPEDFDYLLKNYNLAKINDIYRHQMPDTKFIECTIFYYACRSGRDDLVGVLLQLENIQINGIQEIFGGNSPLHVASWRGNVNIVVFLLYSGADGKALNRNIELPSIINTSLPAPVLERLKLIWNVYHTFGPEECKKRLKDFRVEEDFMKFSRTISTVNLQEKIPSAPPIGTATTIDGLCSLLSSINPPPPEQFREILRNFDKSQINNFSAYADYKCTPLYCACRAGHVELIKEMILYYKEDLRLGGVQETKTGEGNTPLHVANWNGHIPVVALLLCYVSPEKKTGGSKQFPGEFKECNCNLKEEIRNVLYTLLQRPLQTNYLMPFTAKESATTMIPGRDIPLPLDTYLSIPKEEVPPQYLKLAYLWYQQVGKSKSLLPIHLASNLNTEYWKLRRSMLGQNLSDNPVVKCRFPIPPDTQVLSLFSGSGPGSLWTYETWLVNFKDMTAEIERNNIKSRVTLLGRARSKSYYWKPTEGPWQLFPNKVNNALSLAQYHNCEAAQILINLEKSFFAKPYSCKFNFSEKNVTMTKDGKITIHDIMDEDDYEKRVSWEPDVYLRSYMTNNEALIELKIDNEHKEEYLKVRSAFYLTMSEKKNEIVSIKRYLSIKKSEYYSIALQKAKEVHHENIRDLVSYSKLLWYGSGGLPPSDLIENGWMINYASKKDPWGPGIYFASDAAYSAAYSYQDPKTGHKMMFLARVIVGLGLQCLENNRIIEKPAGYNSVIGWRNGSWIYVLYESHQAFPTYLVEWKEK